MIPEHVEGAYPLTPMQQGMLFHHLYAPDSAVYCVQIAHRIKGSLNAAALRRAWEFLVDRHAALRTLFLWEKRTDPLQVVTKRAALPWQELDWSTLPDHEKNARCALFIEDDRKRGFDISTAPLMRMSLIKLGEDTHQFVWSFHHIILDGWSSSLLDNELRQAYGAFCKGSAPRLRRAKPLYEYISWLEQQDVAPAEVFWRNVLRGFASPSTISAPSSDRPGEGHVQGRTSVAIDETTVSEVQRLSRIHDLTANTIVLGAWALTLGAYGDRDDVVFGSIVSGRSVDVDGIEEMVGLFTNTVPVRATIDSTATVDEWLRQLQLQQIRARQFEYCATADIQRWSDLEPGVALFDTVLSFENFRLGHAEDPVGQAAAAGAIEIEGQPVWENAHHAIVLSVQLDGHQVGAYHDLSRVPDVLMRQILERFKRTLHAIAGQPGATLGHLQVLDGTERQRLLDLPNECAPYAPDRLCAHAPISERAHAQPDNIAVVCNGAHLSYSKLNALANKVGNYLRKRGVDSETVVGACLPRCTELAIGILGILKAGAAFLPIDPEYPDDRIEYMLRDAKPRIVITSRSLKARLSAGSAEHLCIDDVWPEILRQSAEELNDGFPDSAAYIIYTSGSTGKPKGVVGTHTGLVNRMLWFGREFPSKAGEPVLAKSSLSFIDGLTELLTPLLHGGTVVLANSDAANNTSELGSLIARERIGRLTLVPSLLRLFVDGEDAAQLESCRLWVTSGEALPRSCASRFREVLPDATLLNLYGASEASGDSLWSDCTQTSDIRIGRPIRNTRVYVLNRSLEPVPVGAPGELYIGGGGLARGYLNHPKLTATAFVADPFGSIPGGRLYRTGDLVKLHEDGQIEFLGRADHQTKIRGCRVELGEIEAVAGEVPNAGQAVAVLTTQADPLLALYITAENGDTGLGDDVRKHLEKRMPPYMVPSVIRLLDRMPTTRSGKIDRVRLAKLDTAVEDTHRYDPPAGDAEQKWADLFREVLKLRRVSATASFLRLGGDSLQAVRLTALAKKSGIAVTPRQILELRTVRALAAKMHADAQSQPRQAARMRQPKLDLVLIGQSTFERVAAAHPDMEDVYPLTPAQQEMLAHSLAFPRSGLGTLQFCMNLEGPIQPALLRDTWQRIIDRHEALRTSISLEVPAEPVQVVHGRIVVPWHEHDWSMLSLADSENKLHDYLTSDRTSGFALDRASLLRLSFIKWQHGTYSFILTVHHIVIDGWSLSTVFREVELIYNALSKGIEPNLPAAPSFHDYVRWLKTQDLSRSREFWRERLRNLRSPVLLSSAATPPQTEEAPTEVLSLPVDLSRALERVAHDADVTLATVVQAAWALLLRWQCATEDVVFGVTVAGRPAEVPGVDQMVGMFINILPLRLRIRASVRLREWLAEIHRQQIEMRQHEHTPRSVVHECSGLPLNVPLYDSVLVFQDTAGAPGSGSKRDRASVATSYSFGVRTGAPLSVVINPGVQLTFRFAFDNAKVARARVRDLVRRFEVVLELLASQIDPRLGNIDVLTEDEKRSLRRPYSTATEYLPVVAAFSRIARQSPQRSALTDGSRTLTYSELEERTEVLSEQLAGHGAGIETAVGLLLTRAMDRAIGLLAVLKAGATAVPISLAASNEEIARTLQTARPPVIVTDSSLRHATSGAGARIVLIDDPNTSVGARASRTAAAPVIATACIVPASDRRLLSMSYGALAHGIRTFIHGGLAGENDVYLWGDDCSGTAVVELLAALSAGACVSVEAGSPAPALLDRCGPAGAIAGRMHQSALRELSSSVAADVRVRVICTAEVAPDTERRLLMKGVEVRRLLEAERGLVCAAAPAGAAASFPGDDEGFNVLTLNADFHASPAGRPWFSGASADCGYFGDPSATAEHFLPDPYSDLPGARMFAGAGRARRLEGGRIEVAPGQSPDISGWRGARDLREIERVLLSHGDIDEAAAEFRGGAENESRAVAYVVAKPGVSLSVQKLRQFARKNLQRDLVPDDYVVLPALPRNTEGEIDRTALPSPLAQQSSSRVLLMGGQPGDILEFQLARIWEEVFGISPVTPDDDFFALGGDSLIGLALATRIKSVLSFDLPLSALYEGATIRQMASLLRRQSGSTAWGSLVPVRTQGNGLPFFCVHPIGGNVLGFVDLVRYIDSEYPFYALQSIGLDGVAEPCSTVERMAEHYRRELRAIQPHGPYLIGGLSFGGLVAFELARQLEQEGAELGLVALLDMECPMFEGRLIFRESMPREDAGLLSQSGLMLRKFYRENPEKLHEIEGVASRELIGRVLEHMHIAETWRENARRIFTIFLHSSRALRDYVPRPYSGRVTVFRSTDNPGSADYAQLLLPHRERPEAMLAWGEFARGGVELIDVPGDHVTMMAEPHVRFLGQKLSELLKRRQHTQAMLAAHAAGRISVAPDASPIGA